jgi:hypothetical protein
VKLEDLPCLADKLERQFKNCIARNQRWLRENPHCAGMTNPENYHAEAARREIAEAKAKLVLLRRA